MGVKFDMPWIPPDPVRGNSRSHYYPKARRVKQMRESGLVHGREAINTSEAAGWPLSGNLSATYYVTLKHDWVDFDNLAIGFKGFIDGLADAGIIIDDKQVVQGHIYIEMGDDERSVIVLQEV